MHARTPPQSEVRRSPKLLRDEEVIPQGVTQRVRRRDLHWSTADSEGTVSFACQILRGITGNSGNSPRARPGLQQHPAAGQRGNCHQEAQASQADGSGSVLTGRPSWLPLDRRHPDSVAEASGSAARHTRAWSVGEPAIVADCRRLRHRRLESTVHREDQLR